VKYHTIPMDQPEHLMRAQPGDHIIEIIKPVWRFPHPWKEKDDHERMRIDIAYYGKPEPVRHHRVNNITLILEKTGGGLTGKGNINIDIHPLIVTYKAPMFFVKHWKVVEVKE